MTVENNIDNVTSTTIYVNSLVKANPDGGTTQVKELDNHVRGLKNVILNTFTGITGLVRTTHTQLEYLYNVVAGTVAASKAIVVDSSKNADMGGGLLDNLKLQSHRETTQAVTVSGGTLTLNCNDANIFTCTMGANATTLSITNVPTSVMYSIMLIAYNTTYTLAEPSGAKWSANVKPPNSNNATGYDIYQYITVDGGSTWHCFQVGYNMS